MTDLRDTRTFRAAIQRGHSSALALEAAAAVRERREAFERAIDARDARDRIIGSKTVYADTDQWAEIRAQIWEAYGIA